MREHDYDEFSALLDAAYDLIGSGQNKTISPQAKALFFKALGQYSIEQFRFGLNGHCIDKQRGRFTPKPADIIEQIDGATGGDGRPSDDEAWAIALTSQDEADTVVWTQETAEAFGICQPVMATGDKVGARMAFKDAYNRLVAASRQSGSPAKWNASLGWDMERRAKVIEKAATAGLLPAPMATALLGNSVIGGTIAECPEGLKRVKEEMAKLVEKRQEESAAYELARQAERDAEQARKNELAEQAASLVRS
ncbi:Conserved hypothetical protein [Herminiimonas arsenicoxydans]|uniref:Bacteriophage protein n=1 Tax=Herminiimonas arsenicoxydans TaxID=204773 RepID=A4G7D5_HERAR|nr:Conserved hypothetical protein [Herminiimonas arsenicoxydans]